MAGDWIKVRVNLGDDPAVIGIAERLQLDPCHVIGCLVKLWSWADQQTENGNAHSVTAKWVDGYAGVTGFAEAMQSVRWLTITKRGISFPAFDKHNGQTAKRRALTARRVSSHKAKSGNAGSVTRALPREEKRREEIRIREPGLPGSASQDASPLLSGSDSGSQLRADVLILKLEAIFGRDGNAKQFKANRTTWTRLTEHINAGAYDHLSRAGPLAVAQVIIDKARDLTRDKTVKRPIAAFTAWCKEQKR